MNALPSVSAATAIPGSQRRKRRVDHHECKTGFPSAPDVEQARSDNSPSPAANFRELTMNDPRFEEPGPSSHMLGTGDSTREGQQRHPTTNPSDAEKYRWIRSNRGNFAITEALAGCDKDAEFDDRIATEMAMCAAGKASYRIGPRRP